MMLALKIAIVTSILQSPICEEPERNSCAASAIYNYYSLTELECFLEPKDLSIATCLKLKTQMEE